MLRSFKFLIQPLCAFLLPDVCVQVSDGSLTVLSITREDRGAYTCRAFSPQGEAIHTTRLLVQGKYMWLMLLYAALQWYM